MEESMVRLVIIDDDLQMLNLLKQRIAETEEVELVGTANTADAGLKLVRATLPDAVLLDLVMPGHDGFYILEELNRMQPKRPICIMVSALNAPHIISRASELGVDHFVLKPFDLDLLFQRITEINTYKSKGTMEVKSPSRKIDDFVQNILDSLSLSHSLMGYRYIRSAVRIGIEEPATLDGITKSMYPKVAKKYKSTPSRVERAIRHSIQSIWTRELGPAKFAELMGFPYDEEKPTNSHFIASIVGRYKFFYPDAENL
ncbi:MAG: response regulator [Turicibacter sp.]|nr:response regulator [Turicibacter sp.]